MIPALEADGTLPAGIHEAGWDEIEKRFGSTPHRRRLLDGFRRAALALREAGCKRVYLDGSFVTSKEEPGDFDACWEVQGVSAARLDPVLRTFNNGRVAQKMKYGGELFPAMSKAEAFRTFLDFFQISRDTGEAKGIVAIDLGKLA